MEKLRIMIVDDEKWAAADICGLINQIPIDCEVVGVADNPDQALILFEKELPNIIICDIRLGSMSGLDFLEQLLSVNDSFLSIIVSAYSEFEYAKRSLQLGAIDYLEKPVNDEELLNALKKCDKILNSVKDIDGEENLQISHEQIRKIVQEINDHYMEDLTLSGLADKYHFNVSYLSNLFRTETSYSFSSYLRRVRMQAAVRLIAEQSLSLAEISVRVGYNDYFHFSKQFKKLYGCSPNHYSAKREEE